MLSQNQDGFIYVANNEGLLEYNGSQWKLYPTSNNSIMRSVICIDDYIYTGAYMDFGFWKKNKLGTLVYTSLNQKFKINLKEDEQFWGIFIFNDWIIFQSLQNLYLYNPTTNKIKIISSKTPIFKAHQTPTQFLYQNDEGLMEIENFESKLLISNEELNFQKIINVFSQNNQNLLVSQSKGLFFLSETNQITPFATAVDNLLKNEVIYSAIKLQNGNLALGTISNGLLVLSPDGSLVYHITQPKGLNNNTVLALFEDVNNNLWLGLDNGINVINKRSTIKNYTNLTGLLGTVYATITFQNNLYIGTNQGLFFKPQNSTSDFELVSGTKGQVWSLFEHNNTLFCGHDLGTFIINQNKSEHVFNLQGTWKFEVHNNKIIQGNYYGLSTLIPEGNSYKFDKKIEGFNFSCRYFELISQNQIIVNHEYRGLYHLKINEDFSKVNSYQQLENPQKGKHSGLIKHHQKVYYASADGIYVYQPTKDSFVRNDKLSTVFDDNQFVSGRMISDKQGMLWLFTKDYLYYFVNNKMSNELSINRLPIASNIINTMLGYENIYEIEPQQYIIGTTNGYYILNKEVQTEQKHKIFLTQISQKDQKNQVNYLSLSNKESIAYQKNHITFNLAVPQFNTYVFTEYQYILEGHQEDWSDWSQNSNISFENLSPGEYTFKAKGKVSNVETENFVLYSFEVKKPWYGSNVFLLICLMIGFVLIYFVHKRYQKYYQDKHQKIIAENNLLLELKELENQKEIMKIKNEQLTKDVDQINKELAASTMTLLKKDELLRIIKEDLKNTTDAQSTKKIKSVINVINRSVKDDSQWNVFKDAFDKADNDFIKKIKEAHPSLTPNDLRLCAYLRLNLSSKEIAPLLNISVRSVEIKRYRLRKKMDLEHEKSLVDYILSI